MDTEGPARPARGRRRQHRRQGSAGDSRPAAATGTGNGHVDSPPLRDGREGRQAHQAGEIDRSVGDLALHRDTISALRAMNYSTPTEIQQRTIPPLLAGRDVVGQAQTGSGKTAAFGIPMVERVVPGEGAPQAIVLVPTRELAMQVAGELRRIGESRGLRVVAVYGGQAIIHQLEALKKGAEVVVGTPGRVMDHITRRTLLLNAIKFAVLDEADRMLDIGFADDMEWILSRTPRSRQTALFSATIPSFVRRLIRRYMDDPAWVRVGDEIQTVDEVEQYYYEVATRDKLRGMVEILDGLDSETAQVLIFCRTQLGVDRLVRGLKSKGYPARGLHGGMSQADRNAVMTSFRGGTLSILASTNLAARGIDILTITHVINYDMPENVEEYVHRIGRTARMGMHGTAISLVGEWDLELLARIAEHLGSDKLAARKLSLYR